MPAVLAARRAHPVVKVLAQRHRERRAEPAIDRELARGRAAWVDEGPRSSDSGPARRAGRPDQQADRATSQSSSRETQEGPASGAEGATRTGSGSGIIHRLQEPAGTPTSCTTTTSNTRTWRIRRMLQRGMERAGISKVEIERTRDRVRVDIHTARPGIVIGAARRRGRPASAATCESSPASRSSSTSSRSRTPRSDAPAASRRAWPSSCPAGCRSGVRCARPCRRP